MFRVRWSSACLVLVCVGLGGSLLSWQGPSPAQETTIPPAGLREHTPTVVALTNIRIIAAPGQLIERGTVVIRDGTLAAVGADVEPPPEAHVIDGTGRTVYPGLIDAYTEWQPPANTAPAEVAGYWNSEVTPTFDLSPQYRPTAEDNKKLRTQGVTCRLVAPGRGIIRGTSVLISTGDEPGRQAVLKERVALHARLAPTTRSRDAYPSSPMGAYTLVRQAFYDADWYRRAWQAYAEDKAAPRPELNVALEELQHYPGSQRLVLIDSTDELYFLRAHLIGQEFRLHVGVLGSGDEYRRMAAIAATGRPVLLPVNFPPAPDVKTPEAARGVSLSRLMDWDIAPENPARVAAAGMKFAFTSHGLKDTAQFLPNIRKAVARGLSADDALRALTITPAELYGTSNRLGTLAPGKLANLLITNGDLFASKTKVLETWIHGQRFEHTPSTRVNPLGEWELTFPPAPTDDKPPAPLKLNVTGTPDKPKGTLRQGDKTAKLQHLALSGSRLNFSFPGKEFGWPGVISTSGVLDDDTLLGTGLWSTGTPFTFTARRLSGPPAADESEKPDEEKSADKTEDKKADDKPSPSPSDKPEEEKTDKPEEKKPEAPRKALFEVNYPLGAYGVSKQPEQPAVVLFRGATLWTCGPQGILQDADVLVKQGKIAEVGSKLMAPDDAVIIDLKGKHLTPGVIDCHSHSATDGGINEGTQTITAEVRIGDFVDCDDIQIYRQLAGGVTTINILHGSANTIGGQNQVIKLRWGALPEEMKFREAPQGIKFALGENVKQSNWGDRHVTRYPQSRMGVEQLMRDAFQAARDYQQTWSAWRPGQGRLPPRVDLEQEALAEVLAGKRLIHCHSYRQDEILGLLRTCEDFQVRIGTLQHILEGYKVADAIARHGAGGSSFSDWWAYKIEVYDAIPFNGALMHQAGVVVSFNSDSSELARRLNTEATKAVKYGNLPEDESLKFVTLNPAKQLGIDRWVGSVEVGKHADLAVWSESPLSTFAVCDQTWVDGRPYFNREADLQQRSEVTRMRAALIQRVLDSGEATGDSAKDSLNQWDREDVYCHGHGHDHGHDHDH